MTIAKATVSSLTNVTVDAGDIGSPSKTTLAPSETATFTIGYTPGTVGNAFSFNVSFVTNDADENPYNFTVSGTSAAAVAGPKAGASIYSSTDITEVKIRYKSYTAIYYWLHKSIINANKESGKRVGVEVWGSSSGSSWSRRHKKFAAIEGTTAGSYCGSAGNLPVSIRDNYICLGYVGTGYNYKKFKYRIFKGTYARWKYTVTREIKAFSSVLDYNNFD